MPGPLPSVEEIRATCQAGREAVAKAFGRAFDGVFDLAVGEATSAGPQSLPSDLDGPGLLFVFPVGNTAVLAVLPESSGLVPPWCAEPDVVGQSKLKSLALELGAIILPASLVTEGCLVARLDDLAAGMRRAELAADRACVSITMSSDSKSGSFSIIWPAAKPRALLPVDDPESAATEHPIEAAPVASAGGAKGPTRPPIHYREMDDGLRLLPAYSRSLLKIPVPVTVILAESKQPLQAILNIGPGSIIHFSKSCEDTLTLEVAEHRFAVGETVKVGDKFGLWITSIILPDERFWVIGGRNLVKRAK